MKAAKSDKERWQESTKDHLAAKKDATFGVTASHSEDEVNEQILAFAQQHANLPIYLKISHGVPDAVAIAALQADGPTMVTFDEKVSVKKITNVIEHLA